MVRSLLSLFLLPISFTAFAEEMPTPNRMSGSMDYVEIGFPRDEGDHYQDPRYKERDEYKQWYEWWYFNGKVQTTNNRNIGYMVVVFHYTVKDPETNKYQDIMDGNMLICDLDNKKSYFSAWPIFADPQYLETLYNVINNSNFSHEKLDIDLKGLLGDGKTVDSNNYYRFNSKSSNGKTKTKDIDIYEIKTRGRAIIEPGRISKEYLDNMREIYSKKVFEKIREKYSNMGLDLTLELDSEPVKINRNGILDMADGGDSYYYTFPHLKTGGTITVGDETFKIASGDSWMDHQWGDFDVKDYGWEWFSIRLENGIYANIFIQVDKDKNEVKKVANFVLPDRPEPEVIGKDDFSVTAREDLWTYDKEALSDYSGINAGYEGMTYPQEFTLDFPSIGLCATIKSEFPHQFGFWYWEGFGKVEATLNGKKLSGFAATELIYPKRERIEY
ncbi:MAG: hypothetical protein D8M57_17280 [Candidatus Scalindua sp. AMX11]|nr:MAG: hypothetical protein DWQ00_10335 [Candidatus Scalindua sp.]NOG82309.1 hypothetical protein [Planctomycetota bacterium]RZV66653.1 MAG: hypothetical protein EX341_17405 [Candidatus Scalindua sp. SCAELEC01]TDE63630.1 MAG: hypothetical protein D8M57_17280 [Candidatus Scalindua sp. AMX11]GJQ59996.1 MAG: hypothetical protein SCALA701_27970 [Candidatus Scalindua sp.]